jgi:hypothetical protein
MLNVTSHVNRANARRHRSDYAILHGVAFTVVPVWADYWFFRGTTNAEPPPPSRTTYNKIAILNDLIGSSTYDRLLLLDADALIADFDHSFAVMPFDRDRLCRPPSCDETRSA